MFAVACALNPSLQPSSDATLVASTSGSFFFFFFKQLSLICECGFQTQKLSCLPWDSLWGRTCEFTCILF